MRSKDDNGRLSRAPGARTVSIKVDGEPVEAYVGESVAAALLARGRKSFRHTERRGAPRGVFCGMGICFDCLVTINGEPNVRACMTSVEEGMTVETGADLDE